MSYHADKLGDGRTDGRTDAGNDNTRRPILASGKNILGFKKKNFNTKMAKIIELLSQGGHGLLHNQ